MNAPAAAFPRRAGAGGILASLLAVTACSPAALWEKPVPLPCPDHRIPAEAASLVQFRDGDGRDLTDVEHQGRLVNVRLACRHHLEDDGSGLLEVEVSPILAVERGPADTDKQAPYPYFIAVTDTDHNILFRERLEETVAFPGNRTRQVLSLPTSVLEIALASDKRGPDYVIYVGFELDREQVEFNRKQLQSARP